MRIVFFVIFCFQFVFSAAQDTVHISIYNELPLRSVVVSASRGAYRVMAGETYLFTLRDRDLAYLSLFDGSLILRNSRKPLGDFSKITFESLDSAGVLRVTPIGVKAESRLYDDNMAASVAFGRILMLNEVATDHYIAGVVEAEAGPNAAPEFYKAQSVLARTYLYGHMDKHASEGFNLCDGVHCQAYKGKSVRNPAIAEATRETSGLVVIGPDSAYITAAFHANCGGYTESSENAWLQKRSYLVSVKDPFCQNSSSAHWTKNIPLDEWKNYLKGHGFKIHTREPYINFDFLQTSRKQYYVVKNDSIPFKQIRGDFGLKSTFFSVVAKPHEIELQGRGFGHGVGMCQEGAMQMAKAGYRFTDILNFYYKGISIANVKNLKK